jgi:eukaryotic-like serine/threonine-protein kinase
MKSNGELGVVPSDQSDPSESCDLSQAALDALPPAAQQRLAELLEQCLAELEQGRQPDIERLTANEPALAEPLREYLGSLNFLQQAAAEFGTLSQRLAAPTGIAEKQLGDYEVLREIGRGGMGVVYEARQISLDRRVALKVLPLAGLLDQKQIARFQREARAAAHLHHPHIVPIFSVGCERGVHYYAMQYVDGQPLDRAIREVREASAGEGQTARGRDTTLPNRVLPDAPAPGSRSSLSRPHGVRDRDYFRTVATLGVQAAEALHHAHEYGIIHRDVKPSNLLLDGEGKLWVTDFGLARFQAEADRTATGDVVGTLRYMSPEQAEGKSALIDPRTDVYSLGITLYELLTLRVPFDDSDRQQVLRRIADEEPASPRRVNAAVPLDLETIVLKAIAKAREDRYGSARDLAEDLKRFLNGQSTLARRPTLTDRASKWIRRHRRSVGAAVAIMAVALVGLSVGIFIVLNEHTKTRAALAQSEANYRRAREVVDRFATRHAERLAALPGAEPLRQELLGDALEYYRGFLNQQTDDSGLRADLAVTHFKIANITEQLGDRDKALAAYREAQEAFELLADDPSQSAEHRDDLALCHNNIGLLLGQAGKTAEAETSFRNAIELLGDLIAGEDDANQRDKFRGDLALCYGNLALVQGQANRPTEADASYHLAVEIQQQLAAAHPAEAKYAAALALSYNNMSYLLSRTDSAKAEQCCRQAIAIQEKLVAEHPDTVNSQSDLALSQNNFGALQSQAGRPTEAKTAYQQAIDIQRQLVRRAPAVLTYRRDLAISYNNLGRTLSQLRDLRQAETAFQDARAILEDLVRDHPAELNFRSDLGGTLNNLARVLEDSGRTDEAAKICSTGIEHQRFAVDHAPQVARFREFLGQQYENYARLLRAQNRLHEAEVAVAEGKKLRAAKGSIAN